MIAWCLIDAPARQQRCHSRLVAGLIAIVGCRARGIGALAHIEKIF
jgi:hypothetical protein